MIKSESFGGIVCFAGSLSPKQGSPRGLVGMVHCSPQGDVDELFDWKRACPSGGLTLEPNIYLSRAYTSNRVAGRHRARDPALLLPVKTLVLSGGH